MHQFDWTWPNRSTSSPTPSSSSSSQESGFASSENSPVSSTRQPPLKKSRRAPVSLKASQLSVEDDIASGLVVDPMLGFQTHKMNTSYLAPSSYHTDQLFEIMEQFSQDQDYTGALYRFEKGGWLNGCPSDNLSSIKAHVITF